MCPFCLSTMGIVVAGAISTGGLAALAAKVYSKKSTAGEVIPDLNHNLNHKER
jgi:hypothetical protein